MIVKLHPIDRHADRAGEILARSHRGEIDDRAMVLLLAPIEEAVPRLSAQTPREALFQLALAAADVAELIETAMWSEDHFRRRLARIQACVFSPLTRFERACGLDRDEFGGSYWAPRDFVPYAWRPGRG